MGLLGHLWSHGGWGVPVTQKIVWTTKWPPHRNCYRCSDHKWTSHNDFVSQFPRGMVHALPRCWLVVYWRREGIASDDCGPNASGTQWSNKRKTRERNPVWTCFPFHSISGIETKVERFLSGSGLVCADLSSDLRKAKAEINCEMECVRRQTWQVNQKTMTFVLKSSFWPTMIVLVNLSKPVKNDLIFIPKISLVATNCKIIQLEWTVAEGELPLVSDNQQRCMEGCLSRGHRSNQAIPMPLCKLWDQSLLIEAGQPAHVLPLYFSQIAVE